MCEFDTEQKILSQANQSERQTEMTYWGYKFEQYVTRSGQLKPIYIVGTWHHYTCND